MKKRILSIAVLLGMATITLTGCNMPSSWLGASTTTNDIDTGYFKKVVVYIGNRKEVYKGVKVYPYNNGGKDSTGGKLEIRANGKVVVLPDDAKVELYKN